MAFKKPPFVGNVKKEVVEEVEEVETEEAEAETEEVETEEVETEEVETEEAEETEKETPMVEEEKKEVKEKKKRNTKQLDQSSITFIVNNVKSMSYTEMADQLGLTKHQVNRTLQYLKEELRKHALNDDDGAYGTKKNKKGEDVYDWSQPISDKAKKIEKKIEDKLSRPAASRVGGGGGGKVKEALNNELDDLLDGL